MDACYFLHANAVLQKAGDTIALLVTGENPKCRSILVFRYCRVQPIEKHGSFYTNIYR